MLSENGEAPRIHVSVIVGNINNDRAIMFSSNNYISRFLNHFPLYYFSLAGSLCLNSTCKIIAGPWLRTT